MNTQGRLLLLLIALVAAFATTLTYIKHLDAERLAEVSARISREKRHAFQTLVELKGAPLRSFSVDYTFWDEMVRFVATGDKTWAQENIDPGLDTF